MPSLVRVTSEVTTALVRGVTDPKTSFSRKAAVLGGFVASGLRFAAGISVHDAGARPAKRLALWEFEGCPHSRVVREALSRLDLDAEVRPCPRGGTRFRPQLVRGTVPQLDDPNTGETLTTAREIVAHLYRHYGTRAAPILPRLKPYTVLTGILSRALTGGRGAHARPSKAPAQPLELWSFEASPYCRLARFAMTELELPYALYNVAKDSPKRAAFVARTGRMQVPWLFDPNTGASMFESAEIERYLFSTYAA